LGLTDSSGALPTQYTYEPFGNTTVSGSTNANPYQYTGRENDGTGLYYYRARYYHPQLQRFISEDPLRLGGGDPNFYAYAGNDPFNQKDPFGLFAPPWHVSVTVDAAAANGYGFFDAMRLGAETAAVDARGCPGRNCSQNPDADHANTHAMRGRKQNGKGRPQKCQEAFEGAQQQLIDDINSGDIPKALHTIEDAYAGGHEGFQFWPGGLPSTSHAHGDWFPSDQAIAAATQAAAQFLYDLKFNTDQLRWGHPIDTTKYFPPNPCGID
jgi:RHS repeat-associated protein